mmetsp:Transcript_21929/g.53985  ORF Transcript_21929/g.53985 Transcript_21929/m.53985 type:complete len:220 (+) Transcript_21929:946-1605(+)
MPTAGCRLPCSELAIENVETPEAPGCAAGGAAGAGAPCVAAGALGGWWETAAGAEVWVAAADWWVRAGGSSGCSISGAERCFCDEPLPSVRRTLPPGARMRQPPWLRTSLSKELEGPLVTPERPEKEELRLELRLTVNLLSPLAKCIMTLPMAFLSSSTGITRTLHSNSAHVESLSVNFSSRVSASWQHSRTISSHFFRSVAGVWMSATPRPMTCCSMY